MLTALIESILALIIQVVSMYKWVVIINAALSWVRPDPSNPIVQILNKLTEPVYELMRKKIKTNINGVDIAPLILIFFIMFVEAFLISLIN